MHDLSASQLAYFIIIITAIIESGLRTQRHRETTTSYSCMLSSISPCDMLCTSGFVDDVIFHLMGPMAHHCVFLSGEQLA